MTLDRDLMQTIIKRYPRSRSAIMPLLHYVQSVSGYVTNEGIETISELLEIETAEVSAVATFYTQYKRKPVGEYHVGVCTNTLCAVMGGDAIFSALKEHLGIEKLLPTGGEVGRIRRFAYAEDRYVVHLLGTLPTSQGAGPLWAKLKAQVEPLLPKEEPKP